MTLRTAIRTRIVLLGIVLLAGSIVAQTQDQKADPSAPQSGEVSQPAPAKSAESVEINNWNERLSYAFGVQLATNIKWQRMNLDMNVVVQALRDAMAGKKLVMSDDEVVATLKRYEEERKQDFEHARAMRADKNRKSGKALFEENLKKEGVTTLPSGLQYKVLRQGEGRMPTLDDKVVCNYRGTLVDGTEFDSSYARKQPATLPVKGLIKGWSDAIQMMPVGSKWQLFIPPQLAYGERVVGGVGPDATLVFDVELISIEKPGSVAHAAPKQQDGATGAQHE